MNLAHTPVFDSLTERFCEFTSVWQSGDDPSSYMRSSMRKGRIKFDAIATRFPHAPSNAIVMWIADMDIPPEKAIISAVEHHIKNHYGYASLSINQAVAKWLNKQNELAKCAIKADQVVDVASVISAVDVALNTYCKKGEKVMVLTPTYGPLRDVIALNDLEPLAVPYTPQACTAQSNALAHEAGPTKASVIQTHTTGSMYVDRSTPRPNTNDHNASNQNASNQNTPPQRKAFGNDGVVDIDLNSLNPKASAFVLCHPNNPDGALISTESQRAIITFCERHNIILIVDEVHSEWGFINNTPASVPLFGAQVRLANSACLIHLNSANKGFNLAGLPGASYAVITDAVRRQAFESTIQRKHLDAAAVSKVALIAAYERGGDWLEATRRAIGFNRELVSAFFHHYAIQTEYTLGAAGYFLWLNLHASARCDTDQTCFTPAVSYKDCLRRGVIGSDGEQFGAPGYIRLNLAMHPALIEQALNRIFFN
ncbi:hypothetical protein D210916BOD24_15690 [Alteromonas sp. D210916BOD_24]|uniref:aminotransferase class I/II-fold pyridoxal phosphate-dependent enzyme n=1 Tax=Alteromonas sp. D210916BOD_24 TaxID=3157618 RepID=UPI00399C6EE2